MIKILTLVLFLASSSSLIANDVFNFVNHEPIKTIEYKTYNYDSQKIKIPIINGIAPEVTIAIIIKKQHMIISIKQNSIAIKTM